MCSGVQIEMYVCVRESKLKFQLITLEPDRLQRDRPATCVIAQQYFSAIFFSLRCHSRKEEFGTPFKASLFSFFFSFLKNLRESEMA
jgi:hypothetical protein